MSENQENQNPERKKDKLTENGGELGELGLRERKNGEAENPERKSDSLNI